MELSGTEACVLELLLDAEDEELAADEEDTCWEEDDETVTDVGEGEDVAAGGTH